MFCKKSVLLLIILFAFRVFNAATTTTFWQPDEYWQALEPAHSIAYGYGYLTWEWRVALRSALHPLLFSGAYSLGARLGLPQTPDAIIWAPRILQAFIAAIGDYYFIVFSKNIFRNKYPTDTITFYSFFITTGSAFNLFVSTRTFSNSLETSLTTIALAYWPWRPTSIKWPKFYTSLLIAAFSCVCRPTNALIWIFLGLILFIKTNQKVSVMFSVVTIGSIVVGINAYLDRWYYAHSQAYELSTPESPTWVFPMLNFLRVNVLESVSSFYGTSPWHYYFVQGLPLLLIGYLPFTLFDMLRSKSSHSTLLVVFIVGVFSLLKHKEVRFIYPIIPILHLKTLNAFLKGRGSFIFSKAVFAVIILLNIIVATFFNTVHQQGVMKVLQYLRNEPSQPSPDGSLTPLSIGFLMPCHSTPWQSHIHRPELDSWDKLWFLTCEPPLGLNISERANYIDVSDQFYNDPETFISKHFPPLSTLTFQKNAKDKKYAEQDLKEDDVISRQASRGEEINEETILSVLGEKYENNIEARINYDYIWPSRLVFFESLEPVIKSLLQETPYYEVCINKIIMDRY